jgi:non-heme chloroperoxidase
MTAVLSTPIQIPNTKYFTWQWRGHRIQYATSGEGQPIILVHGFGASIGHWRKNIPALAAAGYAVYSLDLLGFGASAKAPIQYSIELWAELVADFIEEFTATPAILVGNSIGGLICLTVAADRPELVARTIVLNCAGGISHRPDELPLPLKLLMKGFSSVVSSPISGSLIFNLIRRKNNIRRSLKQVYIRREAITEELVEMLYQPSCDPGAQKVFAAIVTAPPGRGVNDLLPHIDTPIFVIWGKDDPWTPIDGTEVFQTAATTGKNIDFLAIPNAGHCPHDEHPEIVNPAIESWLKSTY